MPCQPFRYSACCGHDEHIGVAVILACECDARSIGGECGIGLNPGPLVSRTALPPALDTDQRSPAYTKTICVLLNAGFCASTGSSPAKHTTATAAQRIIPRTRTPPANRVPI